MKPSQPVPQGRHLALQQQRSGASQPSACHGTRQHVAGVPPALPGNGSAARRCRHSST